MRKKTLSEFAILNSLFAFRRVLLTWYRASARDLPWRRTREPYRVWLSEIMLQQTRVETVLPYFERFTAKFPTVRELADADIDDVLKLWAGLGYYSRARNLHRAARVVANDLDGKFPNTAEALQNLPGVGRYTAAAIASIAFNQPVAVLDGNVKRVLARLFAITKPIEGARTQTQLWNLAEQLLSPRRPGDHNQAMMELGARICLPKNPSCEICPVRRWCRAYEQNAQNRLPLRKRKKPVPLVRFVAAAIRRRGRYLMLKRPPAGLLAGLWHFPMLEIDPDAIEPANALRAFIRKICRLNIDVGQELGVVKHVFTHRRHEVRLFLCEPRASRESAADRPDRRWVSPNEMHEYALTALDRKLAEMAVEKSPKL
jgi:A/G-specific adenine glycosylase